MIRVAVVASSPMEQARLEALVAKLPRVRVIAAPSAVLGADVVLMDEPALRTLPQVPRLPPVVLLARGDDAPAASGRRLLHAGARAVLPRDAGASDIAAAIEAVLAGLIVLHPSTASISVRRATLARRSRGEVGTDPLTSRELEILAMMAEGMRNREIARRLGISSHTVKFHIASILAKLNARSRTDAVMIGMRQGLLMV